MKSEVENILIISYYANLPGACQAEWLDDKLISLKKLRKKLTVISSPSARRYKEIYSHKKCCSISWQDFQDELRRSREQRLPLAVLILLAPIVFIMGNLTDFVQRLVVKGVGEGRWSWVLTSCAISFFHVLSHGRPDVILTTGGPASAHITGLILGFVIRKPVICELQDPLSGGDIGRNEQARGLLFKVEKLITKCAYKTVYVTKGAAEYARLNVNPNACIQAIYPGAPCLVSTPVSNNVNLNKMHLKFVHLGSLYATRNFDSLIAALEQLQKEIPQFSCEIVNLGHVEKHIANNLSHVPFVRIEPLKARTDALHYALKFDVLLLIQNADERSKVTIPYKTYDYLNLNRLVLGLTNSGELDDILTKGGHESCRVTDVSEIKSVLRAIITNNKKYRKINKLPILDAENAAKELIAL